MTDNLPTGYIPKDQRKKILLLSDDLRMPSGVGTMSREIVVGTCHRYNWVQLGAAINHPEAGKAMDASESLGKEVGVPDVYLRIYPFNGYGDPPTLRWLILRSTGPIKRWPSSSTTNFSPSPITNGASYQWSMLKIITSPTIHTENLTSRTSLILNFLITEPTTI